jgi:leucine dehydrogenase
MSTFDAPAFDDHERVVFGHDAETGLKAIIAIHNMTRGPCVGGLRMWNYDTEDQALEDVLRLSRGMTYKSALADLPHGGGKSVIIGNSRTQKTPELLRAMGRMVESLRGDYIIAEDVGVSFEDVLIVGETTSHTTHQTLGAGNPSPDTATGVHNGIQATANFKFKRNSGAAELTVAVQGLGHVGFEVAEKLHADGAKLIVTDINKEALARAADELGASVVEPGDIYGVDADIFAPCALGAVVNVDTVGQMKFKAIAGSANNQLADDSMDRILMDLGILYAPDYVINAGGIISVAHANDRALAEQKISRIGNTLTEIFEASDSHGEPTGDIANRLAMERLAA